MLENSQNHNLGFGIGGSFLCSRHTTRHRQPTVHEIYVDIHQSKIDVDVC